MSLYVPCRDEKGHPVCPICSEPVEKAGSFCSLAHYTHFLVAVSNQMGPIEMEDPLVDLSQMPWHTQGTAA